MNNTIIAKYNHLVQEDDEVFIAGDFTLAGPNMKWSIEQLVNRMVGKKHLILGNHDRLDPWDYIRCGFESVHTSLEIEGRFVLVHDPAKYYLYPGKIVLCGHAHNLYKRQGNVINVGVDVWSFCPVSLDEIIELSKGINLE